MARLRNEDWLKVAQSLPVHGKARIPHRGDRTARPNLVVHNLPDSWRAYCQSCGVGRVIHKDRVNLAQATAPKLSHDLTLPQDRKPLLGLPEHIQKGLVQFLAEKGMDPMYFQGQAELFWSEQRARLLVQTAPGLGGVWLGRDLSGHSPQKWLLYSQADYLGSICRGWRTILVEDTFSFLKLRWVARRHAYPVNIVCCLGTQVRRSLVLKLIDACVPSVHAMLDGDKAGDKGAVAAKRQLSCFGIPVHVLTGYRCDPKDMPLDELRHYLEGVMCQT